MSIPKNRLYELISSISENDTEEVLSLLEKLVEKNKKMQAVNKNRFEKFYKDPLKVEKINIFPRVELYER